MDWTWWLAIILVVFLAALASPWWCGRLLLPGPTLWLVRRIESLGGWLGRWRPGLDLLVAAGNRLFRRRYAATPYESRLLFLPYCLRPLDCPAQVHPDQGLCCPGTCPNCQLGRLRQEALALGYQRVYVVPSSRLMQGKGLMPSDQFIKAKLAQHEPAAALGVVCPWHLSTRLLPKYRVGRQGLQVSQGVKAALQGVLLKAKNCRQAQVDWESVRRAMLLKA